MKSKYEIIKTKKNKKYLILYSLVILTVILIIVFSISKIISNIKDNRQKEVEPQVLERKEEKVTILEGWRNSDIINNFKNKWSEEEMLEQIGERNIDDSSKDQKLATDWESQYSFLESKPVNLDLEGYLFPDTYQIFASSSPKELVVKMLNNFDRKLTAEMRAEIERQGKTIHEIITMASIIEKEAPISGQKDLKDAKIVSGIFWNRIGIGMALQSDATLSYIFNDNNPAHSGSELDVDSPYNSYKYRSLIPGPICNPGIAAIEAAIYPTETDYLYFLTAYEGGQIYYAKTHDEHVRNKYKYLK
ncbi:MAG: endolytic transglycosylase MltG [Patescibacteria group bacterium]|jgi:UPF0755 protein|nr:endolytic transglycosylase MltG [Patescibacteria group bacterium]